MESEKDGDNDVTFISSAEIHGGKSQMSDRTRSVVDLSGSSSLLSGKGESGVQNTGTTLSTKNENKEEGGNPFGEEEYRFTKRDRDSDDGSVKSFKSSTSHTSSASSNIVTAGAATRRWEKMTSHNNSEQVDLENTPNKSNNISSMFRRRFTLVENFVRGNPSLVLGPSSVHLPSSIDIIKDWKCNPTILKADDLRPFVMAMFDNLQLFQNFNIDVDMFSKFMKLIR